MPSDFANKIKDMSWNQRITLARERLGINKSEFARRMGVSTATTADWETGKIKMIDGSNLVKAAKVLGVTPEWIIGGWGLQDAGDDIHSVVSEFAMVYRNSTDEGQLFLRNTVKLAGQTFARVDRRRSTVRVAVDRRNNSNTK